jgi:signal transduction histidine kinase
MVLIERGRIAQSGHLARRLFQEACAPGAAYECFASALASRNPDIAGPLAALIEDGRAFRAVFEDASGAAWEIDGAPRGRAARLLLRDATAEAAREKALAAERDAALREAAALRAALDAAPGAIWRVDSSGAPVWSNRAAAGAQPPDCGAEPAERIVDPDGGAFVLTRAGGGGFRRFVDSVSGTFEQLHIGIAAFDEKRKVVLANPAMGAMFGLGKDWFSARPDLRAMLDRLREARRLPEQSDFPAWRATLFQLFDGEGDRSYEDVWELPDGRSIHVLGRPFASGGVLFVFEDITQSLELQRWRSTAMEVRRATLEMLGEGVAVFGPDGQTRIANPAFRRMWSLDEQAQRSHVSALAERCAVKSCDPSLWTHIRSAVATVERRAPWSGRVQLTDGRILIARVAPMPDGSTLAAFTDVTDSDRIADALRDRAAALEAADEMRNALVDQLSHQLRTPLNAVFGFVDMLLEGRGDAPDAAQAETLRHIRSAADQLRAGVDNLADLASLSGGPDDLTIRAAPLAPILRGAASLVERRAAERGARVCVVIADAGEEAVARGYPARLRQMVYWLLRAALEDARAGDVLTLGLRSGVADLEIWCAGRSCTAASESLALSMARRVAEQHGGALSVESAAAGSARLLCRIARDAVGGGAGDTATVATA